MKMLTYMIYDTHGILTYAIYDSWYILCFSSYVAYKITHWGQVTHICINKLIIIGSDNGLSPGGHQAITWTNAGLLLIRTLEIKFNEILIKIHTFSFKKIHLKMLSVKWRPCCLCLNVFKAVRPIGGLRHSPNYLPISACWLTWSMGRCRQ